VLEFNDHEEWTDLRGWHDRRQDSYMMGSVMEVYDCTKGSLLGQS